MLRDVFQLMSEALFPLAQAFGFPLRLTFTTQVDSAGDILIKVIIHVTAALDAEAALRKFDREWWMHNCDRAHGMLVFDYERSEIIPF